MPSSDVTMAAPAADFADTGATRTLILPKKGKSLFDRSPKPRSIKLSASDRWLRGISYAWISLFALFCLLPFVLIVSASFSSEAAIRADGFGLWPKGFTLAAYELIFQSPRQILGAYAVTVTMTVFGTAIGLFVIAMTGFALYRQDFPFRNQISFFIYFTTLFSAGLAPTFLWVGRDLGLRGTYLAVFLQLLMTPWLIILMKNFMKTVPYEIVESGKIDGAGDFRIFAKLTLPMMKPALATIGLFLALPRQHSRVQTAAVLPVQRHQHRKCATQLGGRREREHRGPAEQHPEDGERGGCHRSHPPVLSVRPEVLRQRHHSRCGQGLTRRR
jgi:putative aldouronate transport system permease protein